MYTAMKSKDNNARKIGSVLSAAADGKSGEVKLDPLNELKAMQWEIPLIGRWKMVPDTTATEAMMATRADECGEEPRPWPRHNAADVVRVAGQLDILAEMLPTITDSEMFPRSTRGAVVQAREMLASYQEACVTTEKDDANRRRVKNYNVAYRRGAEDAQRVFETRVTEAAEARAKELIADLGKIQKNAKRRQARKGAKRV